MSSLPPLYVLGRFPPPYDGQSVLTEQAARLLGVGWNVTRVNTSFQGVSHVETSGQFNFAKLLHYPKVFFRSRKALGNAPDAPVIWPSISPSLVGHFRDLLTVFPAFRRGQKVYGVVHCGDFDRLFRSPWTRYTARFVVRRLSGFVFNDGLAERCAAWIPAEKRFTIPNTIDEATRCSSEEVSRKQSLRAERKVLRVLYLSNMIPSKGYGDVLEAASLLHDQGISFHADFVGRWQSQLDHDAFLKEISERRLEGFVTVHGGISDRPKLKQMYLDADAFVLPTYYPAEAQPLSILEALSAGTPVITTRHAGIPSMLREELNEGLFVEPRNAKQIADALARLRDQSYWRMLSAAAVKRYRDHFSPEAVLEKWISLLAR